MTLSKTPVADAAEYNAFFPEPIHRAENRF